MGVLKHRESGFTVKADRHEGVLSQSDIGKLYGVVSSLMNVAIVERRKETIVIKQIDPNDGEKVKDFIYFSKPAETFCRENTAYLLKHLKEHLFETGLYKLVNNDKLHDTHYKHYSMVIENKLDNIKVKFQLNFVVEGAWDAANLRKTLKAPVSEIKKCHVCEKSTIHFVNSELSKIEIYDFKNNENTTKL